MEFGEEIQGVPTSGIEVFLFFVPTIKATVTGKVASERVERGTGTVHVQGQKRVAGQRKWRVLKVPFVPAWFNCVPEPIAWVPPPLTGVFWLFSFLLALQLALL
ncbi:hypothetical protein TWF173_009779 [Orbilia oligospora]|nr:hypothetical protein TWF173_009779 [Orbilia oligospora]